MLKKVDKIIGRLILALFPKAKDLPVSTNYKNILIIKTVAIGDLVLLLPTIKALKEHFKGAKITLFTTPRVREVVEDLTFIDEIIYYDILGKDKGLKGLKKQIDIIKSKRFDVSVDFEHYYNFTAIIARLAGIKTMAGFSIEGQPRKKLFNIKYPYLVESHELEAFFQAALVFGVAKKELVLVPLATTDEDSLFVDALLFSSGIQKGDLLVGVHPGTSNSAKSRRWYPDRFAEIIDDLIKGYGAKVIITGTKQDKAVIQEIMSEWSDGGDRRQSGLWRPVCVTELSLKQFAELCRRCNLFISVDTGPMHIASAMGTKTVGLFGPNIPSKWGPYGFLDLAVYEEMDCSPCTKQYLGKVSNCTTGDCMKLITVEKVLEKVRQGLVSCKP
ncbi:MAG: glycosyltransferase family 9 protein [Actinobacteria bacterium]|nr:MAG: glycosyltransferase family 9 protein [Actinomycetota bacterium]